MCVYLFPTHVRWLSRRRRRRHSRTDFWTAAAHRAGQIQFICFERVKNKRTRVCKPIYTYTRVYMYTRRGAIRECPPPPPPIPVRDRVLFYFFRDKKKRYVRNPRDRWKVILMETYFFPQRGSPFLFSISFLFVFSTAVRTVFTYIRFVPTLTYIHTYSSVYMSTYIARVVHSFWDGTLYSTTLNPRDVSEIYGSCRSFLSSIL